MLLAYYHQRPLNSFNFFLLNQFSLVPAVSCTVASYVTQRRAYPLSSTRYCLLCYERQRWSRIAGEY